MGVLYKKLGDGSVIREVNPKLRKEILNNYYWPHREKLNQALMTNQNQMASLQGFCSELHYVYNIKINLDAYDNVLMRIVKKLQPKNKLTIFKTYFY